MSGEAYLDENVSIRKEEFRYVILESEVEAAFIPDDFKIPITVHTLISISDKEEQK
jgi:hypothetical protein